jgi:hypothetical protein
VVVAGTRSPIEVDSRLWGMSAPRQVCRRILREIGKNDASRVIGASVRFATFYEDISSFSLTICIAKSKSFRMLKEITLLSTTKP